MILMVFSNFKDVMILWLCTDTRGKAGIREESEGSGKSGKSSARVAGRQLVLDLLIWT